MSFSFVTSRTGAVSCHAAGVWLHSRFDPEREAERLVSDAIGESKPSTVVLLGPCLDYLSAVIRRLVPGVKLIAVQLSSVFKGREATKADYYWYPDSNIDLESFLDSVLDEDSISGVSVISWPPAQTVFPSEFTAASSALRASLDRLSSSLATIKTFGRKWLGNACRFFLTVESTASCKPFSAPCVVAASGPTLLKSLRELASYRGRFALIAVSSALGACRNSGLDPDIVVSTDGGNWSLMHLYPLVSHKTLVAAPMTSLSSASISRSCPFLILDQGSFVESRLIPLLGVQADSPVSLPAHGTVSGTALLLASKICTGPIITAGFDLAAFGEIDHARPNGFDFFLTTPVQRLCPEETVRCTRRRELYPEQLCSDSRWFSSRSLASYASGLEGSARRLRGRVFRLNPSPIPLSNFENIAASQLTSFFDSSPDTDKIVMSSISTTSLPSYSNRVSLLKTALSSWLSSALLAVDAISSGATFDDRSILDLLRSIDIVDYAAVRRALRSQGDPEPCASELRRRIQSFFNELLESLPV